MTENTQESEVVVAEQVPFNLHDAIAQSILNGETTKGNDSVIEQEEATEEIKDATEAEKKGGKIEISDVELKELIVSQYSEYGIKDAGEVQQILEDYPKLEEENENLRKELEVAKKSPVFEDENQKKLFEYVKKYDGTNAEAIADFDYLQKMNVNEMSDEQVLREHYIRTSEMDRDRASKKFDRDYQRKYTSDDADEQEDLDYDREKDAKAARKELVKLKESIKLEEKKPEPTIETELDKNFTEISGKYLGEFDKSMKGFKSITFENDFAQPVTIDLTSDDVNVIDKEVKAWLNSKNTYSEDGKLRGEFNPEKLKYTMAMALFPEKIIDFVAKEYFKQGEIKVRKEYSGERPNRVDTVASLSGSKAKTLEESIAIGIMSMKK